MVHRPWECINRARLQLVKLVNQRKQQELFEIRVRFKVYWVIVVGRGSEAQCAEAWYSTQMSAQTLQLSAQGGVEIVIEGRLNKDKVDSKYCVSGFPLTFMHLYCFNDCAHLYEC